MNYDFLKNWNLEKDEIGYAKTYINYFVNATGTQLFMQKLLDNYTYYSSMVFENIVKNYCKKLRTYFIKNGLNKDTRIYLPFLDNDVHNSFYFGNKLKKIGIEVHSSFIRDEFSEEADTFVIVDDYCGSGEQLTSFLEEIDQHFSNKKIILCPLVITSTAFEKLSLYKLSNNNLIVPNDICIKKEDKYLTNKKILSDAELSNFIDANNILEINTMHIYGRNHTEDLVSFNYFTPNNTLGIFWEKSNNGPYPLFGRDAEFENNLKNNHCKSKLLKSLYDCIKGGVAAKIKYFCVISMLLILKDKEFARFVSNEKECSFDVLIESCKKNGLLVVNGGNYIEGEEFYKYVNRHSFVIKKIFSGYFPTEHQIIAQLESLK